MEDEEEEPRGEAPGEVDAEEEAIKIAGHNTLRPRLRLEREKKRTSHRRKCPFRSFAFTDPLDGVGYRVLDALQPVQIGVLPGFTGFEPSTPKKKQSIRPFSFGLWKALTVFFCHPIRRRNRLLKDDKTTRLFLSSYFIFIVNFSVRLVLLSPTMRYVKDAEEPDTRGALGRHGRWWTKKDTARHFEGTEGDGWSRKRYFAVQIKKKKKRKTRNGMVQPQPTRKRGGWLVRNAKIEPKKTKKKQSEKIRKSGSRCNSKLQRLPILSSMVRWMLRIWVLIFVSLPLNYDCDGNGVRAKVEAGRKKEKETVSEPPADFISRRFTLTIQWESAAMFIRVSFVFPSFTNRRAGISRYRLSRYIIRHSTLEIWRRDFPRVRSIFVGTWRGNFVFFVCFFLGFDRNATRCTSTTSHRTTTARISSEYWRIGFVSD